MLLHSAEISVLMYRADKEYRKGVHWLETLRIRRMKILEAGYMVSLPPPSSRPARTTPTQRTPKELGNLHCRIRRAAQARLPSLHRHARVRPPPLPRSPFHASRPRPPARSATSTTQTQLSAHLRDCVAHISPATDVAVIAQRIPRLMASVVPRPVLYTNYAVGECHDLIFGVSLVDYAQSRALGDGEIPKIVRMCLQEVDTRGLESEGIYRVRFRVFRCLREGC